MLLYVHVPFCRAKCSYCAFHSLPAPAPGDVAAYIAALCAELRLQARHFGNETVESVFFGGGTPTLLPPEALAHVLETIRTEFTLTRGAEISLEANPESVPDAAGTRVLTSAGFNRVSLGVQSFSDERLAVLGRLHSASDAVRAFLRLQDGGFRNIGLDLMWGLPGQSQRAWMEELKQAVELSPAHLSCYGLTLEPGTPLASACVDRRTSGLKPLPGEKDQARMYVLGMEYLASQGYIQYEISNLSRMGFACRHSQGYWHGADYLGVGPAATSTIRGRRWTNPENHSLWRARVEEGRMDVETETIDAATRLLETVMLRLRTAKGLPFALYRDLSGNDFLRDHGPLVRLLAKEGLLSLRNRHARLTLTGMLVSNSIIEKLFERLDKLQLSADHCESRPEPLSGSSSGVLP